MTEPKPVVLPLHHSTILIVAFDLGDAPNGRPFAECECKVMALFWISQKVLRKNAEKFRFCLGFMRKSPTFAYIKIIWHVERETTDT